MTIPHRQTTSYGSNKSTSSNHIELLHRLRHGNATENDAKSLADLHIIHHQNDPRFIKNVLNNPKTIYIYANNAPKDEMNYQKLIDLSDKTTIPIANLQCIFKSNILSSSIGPSRTHFDLKNLVLETTLTIGARVMLTNNYEPKWSLFNGVLGTVIEIVYENITGPHNKENPLPKYIVVDIPSFKTPKNVRVWDKNNPTVSCFIFIIV